MNLKAKVVYDGRDVWSGEGVISGDGRISWTSTENPKRDLATLNDVYEELSEVAANYKPSLIKIVLQ